MPLLIDSAELAGLVIEGCLYGMFTTLIVIAVYGFYRGRAVGFSSHTVPLLVAGGLLVFLCTARIAIDTANVFVAFIGHPDRPSRIAYLTDVRAPLFTTKHSLLVAVLFVGDSFVNWRCWVVWGKTFWIVILPITLSIASAVSGSYTMWAYGHLPSQQILSESQWLTAFYVLSLIANATSTNLLAWRIYTVRKLSNHIQPSTYTNAEGMRVARPGHRSLKPILHIIMESGTLNAAYLLVYTICLVTRSEGLEVMSEMACPLTGIIFIIVIIRVGLEAKPDKYWPSPHSHSTHTHVPAQGSRIVFVPGSKKITGSVGTSVTTVGEMEGYKSSRGDVELGTVGDNHYGR